jgi:hypothetical protein
MEQIQDLFSAGDDFQLVSCEAWIRSEANKACVEVEAVKKPVECNLIEYSSSRVTQLSATLVTHPIHLYRSYLPMFSSLLTSVCVLFVWSICFSCNEGERHSNQC